MPAAAGTRCAASCGLRFHVVQIGAAVSERERAESVEMQKVGAFEIAGAIEQAGRGHVPEVDRPEAESEDQAVCAQAAGGDPRDAKLEG